MAKKTVKITRVDGVTQGYRVGSDVSPPETLTRPIAGSFTQNPEEEDPADRYAEQFARLQAGTKPSWESLPVGIARSEVLMDPDGLQRRYVVARNQAELDELAARMEADEPVHLILGGEGPDGSTPPLESFQVKRLPNGSVLDVRGGAKAKVVADDLTVKVSGNGSIWVVGSGANIKASGLSSVMAVDARIEASETAIVKAERSRVRLSGKVEASLDRRSTWEINDEAVVWVDGKKITRSSPQTTSGTSGSDAKNDYTAWQERLRQQTPETSKLPGWAAESSTQWIQNCIVTKSGDGFVLAESYTEGEEEVHGPRSSSAWVETRKKTTVGALKADKLWSGADAEGNQVDLYLIPNAQDNTDPNRYVAIADIKGSTPRTLIGVFSKSPTGEVSLSGFSARNEADAQYGRERKTKARLQRIVCTNPGLNVMGDGHEIEDFDCNIVSGPNGKPTGVEFFASTHPWDIDTGQPVRDYESD